MSIRVYKYSLKAPTVNAAAVREQIRGAHDYQNDLVAIERARRWATRRLHVGPEIETAVEAVRVATRSTRRAAQRALDDERRRIDVQARCEGGHWAVPEDDVERFQFSPLYERERIGLLERAAKRDAYALARCHWGSRLTSAASADQARKTPLYDRLEPVDVRFRRAHFVPEPISVLPDQRQGAGQIGIHVQGHVLTVADVLACQDTQVRLRMGGGTGVHADQYGTLSICIGTVNRREPVWAEFPIYLHRKMPDAGRISWVRVSCRHDGPWTRWSCEITVDDRAASPRDLDTALDGAIAIEPCWERPGEELRVARWANSNGQTGEIALSARDVESFAKVAGIRSVRDTARNDMAARLQRTIQETQGLPQWLVREATTMHLWKSPQRFHDLDVRCRRENVGAVARALREWAERDLHLWQYEAGARRKILGRRKKLFEGLAATWSRTYRTLIVDTRDFSRLARFGPESDLRFMASPSELRDLARRGFGSDVIEYVYAEDLDEDGDPPITSWPERAIERWRDEQTVGGARGDKKRKRTVHGEGGAWAARKAAKVARAMSDNTARKKSEARSGPLCFVCEKPITDVTDGVPGNSAAGSGRFRHQTCSPKGAPNAAD